MPITLDLSRTPYVISPSGEVNIRCAAKLRDVLVEALSLRRELRLDLAGVTQVDITALQLLWLAEREALSADTEFTLDQAMPDAIVSQANHAWLKFPMGTV